MFTYKYNQARTGHKGVWESAKLSWMKKFLGRSIKKFLWKLGCSIIISGAGLPSQSAPDYKDTLSLHMRIKFQDSQGWTSCQIRKYVQQCQTYHIMKAVEISNSFGNLSVGSKKLMKTGKKFGTYPALSMHIMRINM